MPAHQIHYEWAEDGSLDCTDYGVVVPREMVGDILSGKTGATMTSQTLGVTRSRGEAIVNYIRLPKPAIWAGGPTAKPIVEGVRPHDFRPDPQLVRARAAEDFAEAQRLNTRRQSQRVKFSGPACVVFIADTHIGGRGVDIDRAFADAELIRDTPGMWAAYVGDLVDNFVIGKLMAARFSARMAVPDEWALGQQYLEVFAEKLLAVVGGNHDAWTARLTGVDPLLHIVPNDALFDPDEIIVDIEVAGAEPTSVIMRHKWRGFSMYNPFHPQSRGARFERPGFNIYVGAHTHTHGGWAELPAAGELIGVVQCGTYKVYDPYQRVAGFPLTTHTSPVAVIFHEDGTWTGTSNLRAAARIMRTLDGQQTRKAA